MTEVINDQIVLQCGDCLELLKQVESSSVSLCVTSPPYSDQRKSTYGGVPPDQYVAWMLPIAKEIYRVLKDDGSFVLNILCGTPHKMFYVDCRIMWNMRLVY